GSPRSTVDLGASPRRAKNSGRPTEFDCAGEPLFRVVTVVAVLGRFDVLHEGAVDRRLPQCGDRRDEVHRTPGIRPGPRVSPRIAPRSSHFIAAAIAEERGLIEQ